MFGSRNFLFAKGGSGAAQFKLFMWGDNPSGVLGLGNITGYSSPKQVGALTDWATLSSNYHTLCTKVNGQLWAWGNNGTGRLGLGNTTNYSSPKQVGALTSWGKPTTGNNFSLCIKTDGTLWSWGNNALGQLGLGNTTAYSSPKQIGSLTTWSKAVSTFRSVLATDTAGKLFAWGKNSEGQLGLGDLTNRSSPVQVGALTNWSKPTVAYKHSLCLKTDGTLWAWGANASGQLGLGNTTAYSSPKQVGALTDWALPSVGYQSSFSVCTKTDGTLWSWGSNSNGALGLNNATSYSSPKQIGSLTTWLTPSVAGDSASCVKTDGTLWTWGRGSYGSLGDGTTANRSSPVQIGTLTNWVQPSRGVSFTAGCIQGVVTAAPISLTVPVISGTAVDGYTLTSSYGTWSSFPASFAFQWQRGTSNISGATSSSYLVDSADIGSTLRCVVTATNSFGAVSANSVNTATVTAFTGGQLWTWGRNISGQLGLGNTTNYSSPKQVGSSVTWTKIQGGYRQMFAINATGQLWSWGLGGLSNNAYFGSGLGVGDATYRSSPTQVGALTNWAMVAGGGYGGQQPTASVKTDGTLWTWGSNSSGGLATTGGATVSPNQVGALTDWAFAAMGIRFGACIKTTGTLWTWGRNSNGQLGLGDTTVRSSPTQVGALTNWKIIACSAQTSTGSTVMQAIKTDGTLWGWGDNTNSILGTGNATSRSSPVQIGSDTDWAVVWIGRAVGTAGGIGCATKTNGTFWVWGVNSYGCLGTGNTTNYNSPVQLGTLTNWLNSKVSAGENQMTVVKSDGTLWTWGNATYGRNGLGDVTNRSSPTQIGALTTWVTTRTGSWGESNAAIKTP